MLRHGKMAVITRHGAKELAVLDLHPRLCAQQAVQHGVAEDIEHHGQAAVAAHHDLLRPRADHTGQQGFCFGNAVQPAVIAAVGTILTVQHAAGVQFTQHALRKCQLLRRRLSAGKIQLQALLFVLLVALAQTVVFPLHFFFCHILILHGVILPGQYRQGRLLTWCS